MQSALDGASAELVDCRLCRGTLAGAGIKQVSRVGEARIGKFGYANAQKAKARAVGLAIGYLGYLLVNPPAGRRTARCDDVLRKRSPVL